MASGYDINAKPAPPLTTLAMSVLPVWNAKFPRMPNVMQPAIIDEQESIVVIITISLKIYEKQTYTFANTKAGTLLYLYTLRLNLLYEA